MIRQSPLCWPAGRPRLPDWKQRRAAFAPLTIPAAADQLAREVRLLGADESVHEARLTLNAPRPGSRVQPEDVGVALYFRLDQAEHALACDAWDRVEHNIRAIVLHTEALRGLDRWGVGTLAQSLRGYLVAPAEESWWDVLGITPGATPAEVEKAFQHLALAAHPDRGGSAAALMRLTSARAQARRA